MAKTSAVSTEVTISKARARQFWIDAQRLNVTTPFGHGPDATRQAVEHLGYVQIDTINVIERCHHHILFNRIPQYKREDLRLSQSRDKTVFEYWTHALSYVPVRDYRFYLKDMRAYKSAPSNWHKSVSKADIAKLLRQIKKDGPLTIRDIDNDVLVDKNHPWASRKPSKKVLEFGFYSGDLVISERVGMLKKYELSSRHFNWTGKPKAASDREITAYLLDRALTSQALVSLDSVCYLDNGSKPAVKKLIQARLKSGELVPLKIEGVEKFSFWIKPEALETKSVEPSLTHLLSPFDPLVIQRKRLNAIFDYEHRFEAYLPKQKRVFGYFALPVLSEDKIIALLDLKTDRQAKSLLVQSWHWTAKNKSKVNKSKIEAALHDFEKFQLGL